MEKSFTHIFEEIYKNPPQVFSSAPGRINIIGEHTDYNQGYVLPAAVNLRNYFLASKRKDERVFIWADDFKKKEAFSLHKIVSSRENKWINYVKGILWVLEKKGLNLQGINGLIAGNIPLEAGLSSSAALEISILYGVNALFKLNLSPEKMAKLAQKAENDFVGVKCGLMDQFISVFGKKNKALFLDCENLQFEHIPLRLDKKQIGIIVYDSGVRRKLASSEYNKRRQESANAFEFLKNSRIKNYKDANLSLLEEKKGEMGETLYKRARHIISENERVKAAVEALKNDNFSFVGELLFQSHKSLRDDYEVSCSELDLVYEIGREFSGCLGARLIGAGFGGSGIAMVKKGRMDPFREKIFEETEKRRLSKPKLHKIEIGEGARMHPLKEEFN